MQRPVAGEIMQDRMLWEPFREMNQAAIDIVSEAWDCLFYTADAADEDDRCAHLTHPLTLITTSFQSLSTLSNT